MMTTGANSFYQMGTRKRSRPWLKCMPGDLGSQDGVRVLITKAGCPLTWFRGWVCSHDLEREQCLC